VSHGTPTPRFQDTSAASDIFEDSLYRPRDRVMARPIERPLDEKLTAPSPIPPMAALTSRRLPGSVLRPKALIVYVTLIVVLAQTLVGTLTPLGRSERLAIGGALTALGAVAPAVATPIPILPTPHPVSSPAAFIATMLPIAQQAHRDLGWPVSVVLAQMGVEHGWSFPDFDGWNLANSKVFPDPNGDGGVCFRQSVVRSFCYATTPQIGLAIYEHVAHLSYYRGIAAAARSGGAAAAARALGASPWDEGHYALNGVPGGKLLVAMSTYNLYQYDT